MRVQGIGDDLVGSAVISNAMQYDDRAAIPGCAGRPVAVEESSLVGRGDESISVGDLARKMRHIFGRADLGRHGRL
jgi:hypothetical protein